MSNYKDKEDQIEYNKKYHQKNRERLLEWRKKYRKENREKCLEQHKKYNKKYYIKNKEKLLEQHMEYYRKKYKTDLKFHLNDRMKNEIYKVLKGNKNGRHWEDLVGYTLSDLIKHLKRTIPKGFNWKNYLDGKLHIDHIIPKSIFNFTKSNHIDFKKCWALGNLRLLPAKENRVKSNNLNKPFQPALQI